MNGGDQGGIGDPKPGIPVLDGGDVDVTLGTSKTLGVNQPLVLRIKTTYSSSSSANHDKDFFITVELTDSVSYVKQLVLRELQVEPNRYLRLICQGRLLAPDTARLESFALLLKQQPQTLVAGTTEDLESSTRIVVVHAVVAAVGQQGGVQAVLQQQQREQFSQQQQQQQQDGPSATAANRIRRLSQGLLRGTGIGNDGRLLYLSGASSTGEDEEVHEDDGDGDADDGDDDSDVMLDVTWPEEDNNELSDVELGIRRQPRHGSSSSGSSSHGVEEPRIISLPPPNASGRRRRRRQSGNAHVLQRDGANSSQNYSQSSASSIGFDRLRQAPWSLSNSQVQAIRAYFSSHVDDWLQQFTPERLEQVMVDVRVTLAAANNNNDTADSSRNDDPHHRRPLLEEAWMQAQGSASEFWLNLGAAGRLGQTRFGVNSNSFGSILRAAAVSANRNAAPNTTTTMTGASNPMVAGQAGTDRDFTWGFLMGFFVGFVMLAWVWMPTVPHKQKLGILTGITVQLALTMLQKGNDGEMSHEDGNFDDIGGLLREY